MLRPYQKDALTAVKDNYEKGIHRQLVSSATGTGKSHLIAAIPDLMKGHLNGQTLVLVHREELIVQNIKKLETYNPTLKVSKEKAGDWADAEAEIIVASVSTLGRKGTKRAQRFNWDNISTVITDECHHSSADSYLNVYELADVLRSDTPKLHVGFTATPQRSDGKNLAAVFQRIVYDYPLRKAVEEGWLVEPCGIRVKTSTSLDSVKTTAGDYAVDSLADAINNPERNQLVVRAWLDNAKDKQTVGFTANVQHALDLAQMFRHYGVKCEAVYGDDPERATKLAAHRKGEIAVLLNCGVLVEGYDDPNLECVLLARPTKSGTLYAQMIGRGTRLQEGCGNLLTLIEDCSMPSKKWKRSCLVIDVVDASSRNTLITLPSLFGMSSGMDLKGKSAVKAVQQIESAAKNHPAVDFSKLQDILSIQTLVESADLFTVVFPAEVEASSELSWHHAPTGGYVLMLPNKDEIRIRQNLLDRWELSGNIKTKRYKGERETLEEVFSAADKLVADTSPEVLKVVRREEKWHNDPPTPPQLRRLAQIFKGKQLPLNLTKGQASKLIGQHVAGKR